MTTKKVTISGHEFDISLPYAEGHTLTAIEAAQLNQTRAENVANNCRKKVKELIEAGDVAEATNIVTAYDAEYTFAAPSTGSGRRSMDPVEREARKLARDYIRQTLAEETPPRKLSDVDKDALEAKVAEIAANDEVLKVARKTVADRNKLADIEISLG